MLKFRVYPREFSDAAGIELGFVLGLSRVKRGGAENVSCFGDRHT